MKILLLGHKGYLGSFLLDALSECNADIDAGSVSSDYDYVINCIGKPDLEFCQANPDISEESNFEVIKKAAEKFRNAKIIHFSSYYVYDDDGLCDENANTTDKYFYTKHKLQSEKIVIDNRGLCFRLGKLFGHPDINMQNKLTEHIIKSRQVTLDKVEFNPTSLQQVADVVVFELSNNFLSSLYNLSNSGTSTHLEYGEYINQKLGKKINIEPIDKFERNFHNYGRFLMDTAKLESIIPLRPWQQDMGEYLKQGSFKCTA